MKPPENTETATAENSKPPRRMPWWAWLLLGVFGMNLIGALGCLGLIYLCAYVPDQYANKADSPDWIANNVNQLAFRDSQAFSTAQRQLRILAFNRKEQSDPVPRLLLADLFEMTGKNRAAIRFYQDTLNITEANWFNRIAMDALATHAHEKLALLYYQQGDLAASRAEINELGDIDDDDDDASTVLLALRDRLEEPERSDFRLALARELTHLYQLPMARREMNEALRLARTPSQRYRVLGFSRAGMPIHIDTFSPMTRYYLMAGNAAASDDQARDAAAFYEKAIGETPDLEWAYNSLAIMYRKLNDYARATQAASQAIALNPEFYQPYLTLGDIALDQERFKDAIRHFQAGKAILQQLPAEEGDEQLINLENQLAFAFERIKDYQSAFQHYSRALSMAQESDNDDYSGDYDYARAGLARVRPHQGEKN